ncbi:unnamed protein product [marine sediment metagenome]|uniref:SpoVT-AbrB domain-containing protein n=1 Tax=marine sediment metagenome TaxID=412755 RepID=X1B0L1_9ZZZZ
MTEKIVDLVKPYLVGMNHGSMVVSIPKEAREALGIKAQQRLHVKTDDKGRLIYEPIEVQR